MYVCRYLTASEWTEFYGGKKQGTGVHVIE